MNSTVSGTTGYFYLFGAGQLDVRGEDPAGPYQILGVTFPPGMNTIRFDQAEESVDSISIYARTTPSPSNGNDNPPPLTDGPCSMVGSWDLTANSGPRGAPAASFSFDDSGNFVGGPLGSDLCAGHTMYGTYSLSPGWFGITTNIGFGLCAWWYWAAYPATFDATCTHVTLMQDYDECTGARGYFNGTTILTRRSE